MTRIQDIKNVSGLRSLYLHRIKVHCDMRYLKTVEELAAYVKEVPQYYLDWENFGRGSHNALLFFLMCFGCDVCAPYKGRKREADRRYAINTSVTSKQYRTLMRCAVAAGRDFNDEVLFRLIGSSS